MKKLLYLIILIPMCANAQFVPKNDGTGKIYYKNGKVGIGTSSPSQLLTISDTDQPILRFNRVGAKHDWEIFSQSGGSLFFRGGADGVGTSLVNRFTIQSNGNVGIGTPNPESNFHLSSETSGDAVLTISADTDNNNESDNPIIKFKQDGGNTGIYLGFDESNFGGNIFGIGRRYNGVDFWNLLSINTLNGNIGVGTATPNSKFHVKGGTGEQVQGQVHITGNGEAGVGDAYISFYEGAESNSKWSVGVKDNDNAFSISHGLTMDAEPRLIISDATGNIGLGTTTTDSRLTVFGTNAQGWNSGIELNREGGGKGWVVVDNDGMKFRTAVGGDGFYFRNSYNASTLVIRDTGKIGIGTASPDSKLTVKGDIHTNEVRVDLAGAVAPDFVFDNDYDLKSLTEIETYIKANHHLPDVPSAAEMQENGIELGKMNMLLLQKIEELTLLMIEQQKEIQSLKSEIHQIKTSNK